jgi:hypothetical protein
MPNEKPFERGLAEVSAKNLIDELSAQISELEVKMDDLYMRPRMPFSATGGPDWQLELDADLIPRWVP